MCNRLKLQESPCDLGFIAYSSGGSRIFEKGVGQVGTDGKTKGELKKLTLDSRNLHTT